MKKLQNYLMKPEELRKKLENPRFRQDFIDWNKHNISIHKDNTKPSRSRSPVEHIQHSLQLHPKRHPSYNKQNVKPQPVIKQHKSSQKQSLRVSHCQAQRASQLKNNHSNSNLGKDHKGSQSLTQKNRYNSCTSIDFRKEKGQDKQLKQKYSYRTRQGVQITNPNKVNQDSLLVKTNLAEQQINLYAVADGHGTFGHLVSQYLVKNITKQLQTQLKTNTMIQSIPKVFDKLQKGLTDSDINVTCSGSTFVGVFVSSDSIICSNVGDSRAILARQIDRKSWELIYLSQDHKPSVEIEKKRILKSGGRIHAFRDENGHSVGPQRYDSVNEDLQGLAMSRSFGDNISKGVGVSAEPQIIKMKIDKRDKFVLVASDGVWEFISNQQVLQLIVPYYKEGKLEQACNALSKLAYQRWTAEDTTVVDDITFVLIFFQ